MTLITRRQSLILGAGAMVGNATPPKMEIEKGATLRVLRPTKFVDPDEVIFKENTAKFTKATGVDVRVDFVGWEDLRPQTAVAANTGAGPDVVIGWPDDPHLYGDKLVEMSDVAEYLGNKYGGWYFIAEKYGQKWGTKNWISIPMGGSGGPCVYRESWVKQAGYDKIPDDLGEFLKLCQNLKKNGHPVGFALGNAVGDANAYCNWLLWSHGGFIVDEGGHPALNRPETIEALKYAKELQDTFIPGTLGWQDPSNNKAFINGDIGLTQNGVSIYFVLKNDPKTAEMAADTNHAHMPRGATGKIAETALILNAMVFKHSKYPNASKQFITFLMEQEQYLPWLTGCLGYWSQPLKAYEQADVWNTDPKLAPYRDTCATTFWNGFKGPITQASGAVTANYVNVHMFASVASGQATPEEAVKAAEREVRRYYKEKA